MAEVKVDLDLLRKWIDMPMRELRIMMAFETNGTNLDALHETHGRTRGELIARNLNDGFELGEEPDE